MVKNKNLNLILTHFELNELEMSSNQTRLIKIFVLKFYKKCIKYLFIIIKYIY